MVYAFIVGYWVLVAALAGRAETLGGFLTGFAGALAVFLLWLWAYYQLNYEGAE